MLSLYYSPDLVHWRHRDTLLEDDSDLTPEESARLTGFQYADWQFDGDDIVCLVRTAYAGAHNFHDSNRITFHRIRNFRHSSPGAQPARAIRTNFGPTVKNGWPKETPQLSRQH